jgi:conjugal transfer pilus assembly protein TraV
MPVQDFKTLNAPLIFLSSLLLAGCGQILNPYEEHFKCKAPAEDGKCLDTPSAYLEARYPELTPGTADTCPDCPKGAPTPTTTPTTGTPHDARYRLLADLLEEPEKPLLRPPKILRVLMLPYEGEGGELFMTRYIYLQVENGKWLLTEQKEKRPR